MKPLYPITRPAPILLFIVIILGMIFLTSCSTLSPKAGLYVRSLQKECNLDLTSKDRIVVGYDQDIFKRNYYKVLDGKYFKPAQRVREDSTLKPIGCILICEY